MAMFIHKARAFVIMAAANQSASRILPKLIITGTAAGGTIFACHHLENQRRILDGGESSRSDGCTTSTLPGALSSLQSEYICSTCH